MDLTRHILIDNSLSAQLSKIDQKKSNIIKKEDNTRTDRLDYLSKMIALPIDTPIKFTASDVIKRSAKFLSYYNKNKDSLVAIRLTPTTVGLPILRMRGYTLEYTYTIWFPSQKINADKYLVTFYRHAPNEVYGTIFVVNKHGIFGELVTGRHQQLCIDQYDENVDPITFVYNFEELKISKDLIEVRAHLLELFSKIKVIDMDLKAKLQKDLNVDFYNDYLCGYFETVLTDIYGIWFIDFNRVLGDWYKNYSLKIDKSKSSDVILNGKYASRGVCEGTVFVVSNDLSNIDKFKKGSILVCETINVDYISIIVKAKAIITNIGGILSHTAIVIRELGIPAVVGTTNATELLKNGDRVLVDADQGIVKKLAN